MSAHEEFQGSVQPANRDSKAVDKIDVKNSKHLVLLMACRTGFGCVVSAFHFLVLKPNVVLFQFLHVHAQNKPSIAVVQSCSM